MFVLRTLRGLLALLWLGVPMPAVAEPVRPVARDVLVLVGSDTLRPLVEAWAGGFRSEHSGVSVTIDSQGSGTAPEALTAGRSQLAPMSRPMTASEIEAFEEAQGYAPVAIVVAYDAIAIYVHENNPIRGLTLDQLADIFSAESAESGDTIKQWGDLVYGTLAGRSIKIVGRDPESNTTHLFRDRVLGGGGFRSELARYSSSADVVRAVEQDVAAIGYSSLGHRTDQVQPIALAAREGEPYVNYFLPNLADDPDRVALFTYVLSGHYPLSRPLYLYVNKPPGRPLPPSVEDFLRSALSAQGQQIVADHDYVPLPEPMRFEQLHKLRSDDAPGWWTRLREWLS